MADHQHRLTLEEVNAMDFACFTEKFCSVVEHTPLAAATVWSCRPFHSVSALDKAITMFLDSLGLDVKAGVLRCYPDLAGRVTQQGALTNESLNEHKSAGLLDLTEYEMKELAALNNSYKLKFNFPFVICARENKKVAIFAGIRTRLGNDVQTETEIGIGEVSKIAGHRLKDIVDDSAPVDAKM